MSPTVTTFLFEAANFLVLAAVLGWLFFKPVRQSLSERSSRLSAEQQQAADRMEQAQQAQQEAAAERDKLQAEISELRKRELAAARRQADQILAEARASAKRELNTARRQAVRLSETQRDTLAAAAATAAADTVGELLVQIGGPDLHQALVRSACKQLRSLSAEGLLPVKVELARPPATDDKAMLAEALGEAASAADFRTVQELGVGVRISTAQGLIDASASGLTTFTRQALLREMNHTNNNHFPLQLSNHE